MKVSIQIQRKIVTGWNDSDLGTRVIYLWIIQDAIPSHYL